MPPLLPPVPAPPHCQSHSLFTASLTFQHKSHLSRLKRPHSTGRVSKTLNALTSIVPQPHPSQQLLSQLLTLITSHPTLLGSSNTVPSPAPASTHPASPGSSLSCFSALSTVSAFKSLPSSGPQDRPLWPVPRSSARRLPFVHLQCLTSLSV